MSKPILCLDFDGCLHAYTSGWKGAGVIPDPPVPGALAWMYEASRVFAIVIYSSRSKEAEGIAAMRMWLTFHAHATLPPSSAEVLLSLVTFAHEKPNAFLTIDDRAIQFNGDWNVLDPTKLLDFKPWYQPESQKQPRVIAEEITDSIVHGDQHA